MLSYIYIVFIIIYLFIFSLFIFIFSKYCLGIYHIFASFSSLVVLYGMV